MRNTRENEIIAIALIAMGLLLFLCLFSPITQTILRGMRPESQAPPIGSAHSGPTVAGALLQGPGLAAYLIPSLLLAAAGGRVRSRRINVTGYAPGRVDLARARILGAVDPRRISGLFSDASFNAGGLAGAVIARALVGGLNTIGAAILLAAIAATGLLLATRFSFALFYESLTPGLGDRFVTLRAIPQRFRAWRLARRARKQMRIEMRRQAKAGQAALTQGAGTAENASSDIPSIAPDTRLAGSQTNPDGSN